MKINLILANAGHDPFRKQYPFMPLVLPILAACAPEHDYVFTDLLWDDPSTIDYDGEYDLIGISYRVSATETAFNIADEFRARKKPVILGGPQASSSPLKAKSHADAVVVGEGEQLWPILLEDFKKNELKDFYIASPVLDVDFEGYNTYFLKGFQDISSLPKPKRYRLDRKYTFDMVFAARGCPVNCNFCAVSKLFGTKMRFKNIDGVVEEIDSLGNKFFLLDDNVFGRNDSYHYYKALYEKLQQLPKKRFWTGQANLYAAADDKGREVIRQASFSGLTYAAIGFETINLHDMKHLATTAKMGIRGKTDFMQQISQNIRYIQKQGIAISAWFTIGLEHDTTDSIKDTIAFCKKHHIFPVFTPIQALEGTRFYDELKAKDKIRSQKTNVSNVRLSGLDNHDYIYLLTYNIKQAYSVKQLLINAVFHIRKTIGLKRPVYETIYRIIFIIVTQIRLRKFLGKDIKRFQSRIVK